METKLKTEDPWSSIYLNQNFEQDLFDLYPNQSVYILVQKIEKKVIFIICRPF